MAFKTPRPAKQSATRAFNAFNQATVTVGTKAGNVINVAVQLLDAVGNQPVSVTNVEVYLSDSSVGNGLTATPLTAGPTIGTNGTILGVITANKAVQVITNATGAFDLNLTQSASPVTYYFVIVMPDGSIITPIAVTF